jgi:3-methylcrotonyl-CoA carboxylase alpha subunit
VDTGLIARDLPALTAQPDPDPAEIAVAAVAALDPDTGPLAGFTLWAPLDQPVALIHGTTRIAARVATLGAGRFEVALDGARHAVTRDAGGWAVDGRRLPAAPRRSAGAVHLHGARRFRLDLPDPLAVDAAAGPGADIVTAPMPGLVKAVFVAPGQAVAKGDRLAILEAMKMEHTLAAGRDGQVAEVLAAPGAQVEAGAALIRLADVPG